MAESIDKKPTGFRIPLVRLNWGEENVARYARWENDLTIDGFTYTAAPEMRVRLEKQHGGVADAKCELFLRRTRPPLNRMIGPWPHAPVTARIYEADPLDTEAEPRLMWKGTITKTSLNGTDSKRLVKIDISGIKASLKYPLGVLVDVQCIHTFGDRGCGVDFSSHIEERELAAPSGNVLTLASPLADMASGKWVFGSVEVDGLQLTIVEHLGSSFRMNRLVPPEWEGQTATFRPGCDKTQALSTAGCGFWDNLHRYEALGIAMPVHNPTFSVQ